MLKILVSNVQNPQNINFTGAKLNWFTVALSGFPTKMQTHFGEN